MAMILDNDDKWIGYIALPCFEMVKTHNDEPPTSRDDPDVLILVRDTYRN